MEKFGKNGLSAYIEGKSGHQHAKQGVTNYQLILLDSPGAAYSLVRLGNPSPTGATSYALLQHNDGTGTTLSAAAYTLGLREDFKIASRLMDDDSAICMNGITTKDTAGSVGDGDITSVSIGGGSQPFDSGWIGKVSLYSRGLTDLQLEAITEV